MDYEAVVTVLSYVITGSVVLAAVLVIVIPRLRKKNK